MNKNKEERNEEGAREQCHLKSYIKVAYLYQYMIHLK